MTNTENPTDTPPTESGADMEAAAQRLATEAHAGQADKAGRPYIEHPARVVARVGDDPVDRTVAWLHDVVEDTPTTLADLRAAGFTPEVVAAVDAVTKRPDEERAAYYARVAADPVARRVKLADVADNSDPERLARLDPATRERLARKYAATRAALGVAEA